MIAVIIQFKCRSKGNNIDFFFWYYLGTSEVIGMLVEFLIRLVWRKERLVVGFFYFLNVLCK